MKIKRSLAGLLAFVMMVSIVNIPVSAVDIEQDSFVMRASATVTVDGTTDQTVDVVLTANVDVTIIALEGAFSTKEAENTSYVSLTDFKSPVELKGTNYSATSNGMVVYADANLEGYTVAGNGNVMTAVYTVSKDTPTGNYTVQFGAINIQEYDFNQVENVVYTATISVTNTTESTSDGYTATLAGSATNGSPIRVGDTLKVDVGANLPFSATELTISYNKDLVSFTSASSGLGNVQVKDDKNGTLKLATYGAEKSADDKFELSFTAIRDGDASFAITKAAFGTGESAETADLTQAETPEDLEITIEKASFTVTLDPIFAGPEGVTDGEDYTFWPESATGAFHDYTLPIATLNDVPVVVVANDDGTWTVKNVNGDLVIKGSRTPKTYNVTTKINGDIVATYPDSATYGTDFTIDIPQNVAPGLEVGYNFALESVTVGGNAINVSDNVIPGAQVTGDIVISITQEEVAADQFSVTINSSEVTANKTTVNKGEDVTLTLTPEAGYLYEIQVNGTTVQFTDNKYTIENVQATVSVTVTKTLDVSTFDADEYVQLSEEPGEADNRLYLVTIGDQKIEGMTYTYNNQNMYWSTKYNAYAILVVGATAPTLANATLALIAVNEIPTIAYDYNVNGTDTVDANDAQLVYNMYNVQYSDFTANVTMKKFLEADVNGDKKLDVNDAQAIINEVLGLSAN